MQRGICRLCGNNRELLKRSHIISDFMYEPAYDAKHRLLVFNPAQEVQRKGQLRRPPSAPYDSNILCLDCDTKTLRNYETYAAKLFFGKNLPPSVAPNVQNYKDPKNGFGETYVSNIDYASLKLFMLSLLWRAHISEHSFFTEVSLGPWEQKIRIALLNGLAPDEDHLPMFFMGWVMTTSIPTDMVSQPRHFRWKGKYQVYQFMFRGLIALVFMSESADTSIIDRHKLKADGTLKILNLSDRAMREFFATTFRISPSWV